MILNNYQKAMKEIRLSDTQKEEILKNILAEDIQPVRKKISWIKPVMALAMVVILAVLVMPKRPAMGASGASNAVPAESAPMAAQAEAVSEEKGIDDVQFSANLPMDSARDMITAEAEISGINVMVDSENKIARFTVDGTEYEFTYDTDDEEIFQEELQKFIESIKGKENE